MHLKRLYLRWFITVLIILCGSLATGCEKHAENHGMEEDNEQRGGIVAATFSEQDAIRLRAESFHRFQSFAESGGEQCGQDFDKRYTNVENYYFYCEDLDSEQKIKAYLQQVYTERVAEELMKQYPVKIIEGKAAYVPGDILVFYDWEKAAAAVKEDQGSTKLVEMVVPNTLNERVTLSIEYVYLIEEQGWRINTAPDQEIKRTEPLEAATPQPDDSAAWDPPELAVQKVCKQDDIFSSHGDVGEIVDHLAGEFQRQSPDSAAPSEHEMALMLDRLGECFRDETANLLDRQGQLAATVHTLREKGLALNTDIYLYHEQVEGGGSMYVAMANSFPGMLEIHLHQYVRQKLNDSFPDSDPEPFDSLHTALQDILEEKRTSLQEDELALEILDRISKTVDEWVVALPGKTEAETNLLQALLAKVGQLNG